jgi:hypothetical protein
MLWAKMSPVAEDSTDLGEISPPSVFRRTSFVRLEGFPGFSGFAGAEISPSSWVVVGLSASASVSPSVSPWSEGAACGSSDPRATHAPASAATMTSPATAAVVSRRRRIWRRLASWRLILGSRSLKTLRV